MLNNNQAILIHKYVKKIRCNTLVTLSEERAEEWIKENSVKGITYIKEVVWLIK